MSHKGTLGLWANPLSATYDLQQTTISNFAAFSKNKTNKVWYFMRIVCQQMDSADNSQEKTYLIFFGKFGKMSKNLPYAAVVIGSLRVKMHFSSKGQI